MILNESKFNKNTLDIFLISQIFYKSSNLLDIKAKRSKIINEKFKN